MRRRNADAMGADTNPSICELFLRKHVQRREMWRHLKNVHSRLEKRKHSFSGMLTQSAYKREEDTKGIRTQKLQNGN